MEGPFLNIVKTLDRSPTIKHAFLNEHYHSTFGAIQESNHVFIQAGIQAHGKRELNILELGFGTGLNVWLTALYAKEHSFKIQIDTFEKFPLSKEVSTAYLKALIQENLCTQDGAALYRSLLDCPWNENNQLNDNCSCSKFDMDITSLKSHAHYDIVFFDAFNPDVQPELWTEEIFKIMYSALKSDGILVTYCAKGQVRRNMKVAGFSIEKIAGPPGKREMTRAIKHAQII